MGPTTSLDSLGPGPSPEAVALALSRSGAPDIAWLDSSLEGGEGEQGRWSVVAAWPDRELTSRRGGPDPFPPLRQLIRETPSPAAPLPAAHLILAAGYDLGERFDRFPTRAADDLQEPDLTLRRYPALLMFDHLRQAWWFSALSADARREGAERYFRILPGNVPPPPPPETPASGPLRRNLGRETYLAAVREAKRLITEGEIYQVNLAQRFQAPTAEDPLSLYRRLRRLSPAPYAAFLNWDDRAILSSSPELFLEVRGREVATRPIKGTRPRGKDAAEDAVLRAELEASEKDRSELAMIVDLERNDLGRVSEIGSVTVAEARRMESYATVHHAVATVRGTLKPGVDLVDLLQATFPGGSVTGCPKLRALEVIDTLEPTRRGIYCGAVGWVGAEGACLNLAIRTMTLSKGMATLHAGGGIVADSDPEAEYRETLAKARAMLEALGGKLP
jgi:para-aminobenzoate synthetase component 1